MEVVDLLVVGGGINGAGIARDAAGRGLSVWLCEQDDLASHTSSGSTKLIHGGLRYLENREFLLVRKALAEREILLQSAPHIVRPLRFVLPHRPYLRPAWMIRAGLFLYDHLDWRRSLPSSRTIRLDRHDAGVPLDTALRTGFMYSDAQVQDARLVVLNAMDASARGAKISTRTRCVSAERSGAGWRVRLRSADGRERHVLARALVNATGPMASRFLKDALGIRRPPALRLVKGSHIVVPRLFGHRHAYIFQQPDRRIVFAIPFEQDFTLIGTTEVECRDMSAPPSIDAGEVHYLCEAVNQYFVSKTTPKDIVWSFSAVRPLLGNDGQANASEASRDYRLELDAVGAPLLSVVGGKLTTFRRLAEEAVDRLAPLLGNRAGAWTGRGAPLPGGEEPSIARLDARTRARYPWLPDTMRTRLLSTYGTCVEQVLRDADGLAALGEHFGADLYRREVDYLCEREWALAADDVLWRRTKLGLRLNKSEAETLRAYLAGRSGEHRPAAPSAASVDPPLASDR